MKFKKGDRIKLSQEAIDKGISKNQTNSTGTVIGIEKSSQLPKVRWDELRGAIYTYDECFLEQIC